MRVSEEDGGLGGHSGQGCHALGHSASSMEVGDWSRGQVEAAALATGQLREGLQSTV